MPSLSSDGGSGSLAGSHPGNRGIFPPANPQLCEAGPGLSLSLSLSLGKSSPSLSVRSFSGLCAIALFVTALFNLGYRPLSDDGRRRAKFGRSSRNFLTRVQGALQRAHTHSPLARLASWVATLFLPLACESSFWVLVFRQAAGAHSPHHIRPRATAIGPPLVIRTS